MRTESDRGRDARRPTEIPAKGWKDIIWRVKDEIVSDRVSIIAAGTTFYLLLALFPALAAFVSIYGFVADPVTIADHVAFLGGVLPSGGVELIESQLERLASQDTSALSFGFVFGLLLALWSANNGIKTLFEAMNIAYDETEKRGFIKLNLITLGITLGAIFVGILFITAVGIVPAAIALLGLGGMTEILISVLRWPVLFLVAAFAIAVLYRFGPSRERAEWRWVTWGSGLATVVWIVASILFSWYLSNFADYGATYGSLGAVIGFMMWTWISCFILIAGAELNSEMEHQTVHDTTTGPERPIGARGAVMADTVGKTANDPEPGKGHAFSARPDRPEDGSEGEGMAVGRPNGADGSAGDGRAPPAGRRARSEPVSMKRLAIGVPLMAALGFLSGRAERRRGSGNGGGQGG
ncbi:YihY/virulence factor BrkB family protein [Faunimonas sp. B44]|uniref:YihY/virulence factor BrkB family protein n=1 Tax=Faunimonas sp. B44 TaxID=3461493 RepID=UPI0040446D4B